MGANSAIDDVAELRRNAADLVAAGRQGPLDAPIAACPGWDLATLCGHVGRVHRWATAIVTTREQTDRSTVAQPPEDPAAAVDYLEAGIAPLIDALAGADPSAPCWNPWGITPVVGFWRRRQALETALHRWDGEAAVGAAAPIAPALAVAGVDELLGPWLSRATARPEGVRFAGSLHLHATDHDGEWTVTGDGAGAVHVEQGHAKGDAAVRGPAAALLLLLWRRIDPDHADLTTFGDGAVLDAWLAAGVP